MQSSESSGGNLRLSTSCSAPFSRASGRQATKVYSGRGADIVMKSSRSVSGTPLMELTLSAWHEQYLPLLTESKDAILSVTEDIGMSKPSDLVQGTLDMLLLKVLGLESMNGFAVSQRLNQLSGDVLQVSDGSLYPALHKLEQEGWITAEWKTSEYGRRAKYYSLTRLGRRQLEREADNWGRLSSAISRVIKIKEA